MRLPLVALTAAFLLLQACATTKKEEPAADAAAAASDKDTVFDNNDGYNVDGQADGKSAGVDGKDLEAFAPVEGGVPGERAHDRVFFSYDSAVLSGEAQSTLDVQAKWLKDHSDVKITIEGHCDERGTREYNIALGERRANAVKSYLTGAGVGAGRISVVSYGKERPAVFGADESSHSKNRRGVTVLNDGK